MRRTTSALAIVLAIFAALSQFGRAADVPEPSPSPLPLLPEIGRTRANSPPCAVLRDVVIPSFAAAGRADAKFAETQKRLPRYAQIAADPWDKNGVHREGELARLGTDSARLLQESQLIKKALDDPRLAGSTDPQIIIERTQLQQVYAVQQARAILLSEFVQRETMTLSRNNVGMEDNGGLRSKFGSVSKSVDALPGTPLPAVTGPPGMPILSGEFVAIDKHQIDEWSNGITRAVRAKENEAAKAFFPIAQSCR